MIAAGYSEADWQAETGQARARAVAWHRLRKLVDLHSSDAVQKKARRGK